MPNTKCAPEPSLVRGHTRVQLTRTPPDGILVCMSTTIENLKVVHFTDLKVVYFKETSSLALLDRHDGVLSQRKVEPEDDVTHNQFLLLGEALTETFPSERGQEKLALWLEEDDLLVVQGADMAQLEFKLPNRPERDEDGFQVEDDVLVAPDGARILKHNKTMYDVMDMAETAGSGA